MKPAERETHHLVVFAHHAPFIEKYILIKFSFFQNMVFVLLVSQFFLQTHAKKTKRFEIVAIALKKHKRISKHANQT